MFNMTAFNHTNENGIFMSLIEKLDELIKNVQNFMSSEYQEQKQHAISMRDALKKMKKLEKKLQAELDDENDPELAARLQQKLAITHLQRKKGVAILKEVHQKMKQS